MRQKGRLETKKMLFAAIFAAIISICAQISIPVPFSQVHFSMVLVAVFMCGALLKAKYGTIAVCVYILLGICGMPVFGKFTGGVNVLLGPTGGYIMAYPLMTLCIGLLAKRGARLMRLFAAILISLLICYGVGSAWLAFVSNISLYAAVISGVVGFALFDVIKAFLAAYLCAILNKRLKL